MKAKGKGGTEDLVDLPPIGRPSKCTEEMTKRVCLYIRAGNYREIAAQRAGIPAETLSRWMSRKGAIYRAFRQAVLDAEMDAEILQVGRWFAAAQTDVRAAQEWLARKFPERWAKHDKTELSGWVANRPDLSKLTDEELATYTALAAKVAS